MEGLSGRRHAEPPEGESSRELTGEQVGDTSQFTTTSENLIGIEQFAAKIDSITMFDTQFGPLDLKFPSAE